MGRFEKLNHVHYLEIFFHLCYWVFHFTAANTSWELDWTNRFERRGVAQLTILLYPVIFYLNAFWLIPRLLNGNRWYRYIMISFGLVLGLELIRSVVFILLRRELDPFETSFVNEFLSNDNLLFGVPNTLVFAFLFSSIYRFSRDWVKNQSTITKLLMEKEQLHKNFEVLENSFKATAVIDEKRFKSTFQAKRREGTFLLRIENVTHIKAQGDFVLAFDDAGDSYIINHTLSVVEEMLDPRLFFRINRSEIVNISHILKFTNYKKNRLEIQLRSTEVSLYTSNSKAPDFRKWIDEM